MVEEEIEFWLVTKMFIIYHTHSHSAVVYAFMFSTGTWWYVVCGMVWCGMVVAVHGTCIYVPSSR